MVLYVDETESEEFFIVTGLLVSSANVVKNSYRHFKKKVNELPIPTKHKMAIFTEFKSTLIDKDYKRIKIAMLSELSKMGCCAVYSCYVKKSDFHQSVKEKIYISLLMKIASSIEEELDIMFDAFNNRNFEDDIIKCLLFLPNVKTVVSCDSQKEEGIQFADNLCSVMRLHKTGKDLHSFYKMVEDYVKEV